MLPAGAVGSLRLLRGRSAHLVGAAGDGGPAVMAQLNNPRGLAFDRAGNLWITDSAADVVRRITPTGIIERAAEVEAPWGIAVDESGRVLIGEMGSGRIRAIDTSGAITTLTTGLGFGVAADPAGRTGAGGWPNEDWGSRSLSCWRLASRMTLPIALPAPRCWSRN